MKSLVLGDTHANLKLINERIKEHPEVDNVLQCGDFGIWMRKDLAAWGYVVDKHGHWTVHSTMASFEEVVDGTLKFDRPVIFISGNHENFDYRDSINWVDAALKNDIRFLDNDSLTIDKVKIAGLNGCYSYKIYTGDYQKRKKIKVQPETPPHIEEYLNRVMGRDPRGRFTYNDIEKVKKIKADILLLHEPPMKMYNTGELAISQRPGSSPINELIETMQPRFAFVGHMHRWGYKEIKRTQVIGLPCIENGCIILDTDTWEVSRYRIGDDTVEVGY